MSSNNYKYQLYGKQKPISAVIEFGSDVSGGSDALVFTSVLQELGQKNVEHVIFNLEAVEKMNSSGLGMLVAALSTLKNQKMSLALCNVPDIVNGLLVMTHLNEVFKIFSSVDDAVNSNQ